MPSDRVSSKAEESGWVSCPKCSRRARAGQSYCELCGERLREEGEGEAAVSGRTLRCNQCGASVVVPAAERTMVCPFCGTSHVAQGETDAGRFTPEFVLGFSVTRREAEGRFKAWLGKTSFFTPGDFGRGSKLSELRGVYIPFWSFSMRSESDWSARIGEYWWETITETYTTTENGRTVTRTRTRRVRRTEWYPLSGRFHQFHYHYLVSGSRGLPQALADRIKPFPVDEVTRYAPHFLAGWFCEEYSRDREEAAEISKREFATREERDIASFLPGDTHSGLEVSTEFADVTEDLLLLPIWIFAYTYREDTHRFLVNGATGTSYGKKPISWVRVLFVVLAVLAVVAGIALASVYLSGGF